ncbi:MAG: alanine:cation symporter family protein [Planctomycetes bacterium]|nr:alanine:cation symporter family protein [Planctomycetota bacterium]
MWALPVILLLLFVSIAYCVAMGFGTLRNWRLQFKLLRAGGGGSEEGISPFQTFCAVAAYRVAVGNIGGVCVAILAGGPGALFWMLVTSLITSAIAYAENSLGQLYKVRQDGQYRGGPYNYIESGLGWRPLAVVFALLALVAVPLFVSGAGANNIGMAFQNSMGIPPAVSGAVVAVLLFLVISGGVRRIAKFSTIIVPVMTLMYLAMTIIILVVNYDKIIGVIELVISSAFSMNSIYGGLFGSAVVYGVKRAVNSSGAGMGETPPQAAAAESPHPAEQGLINAFTVYIDVTVCICSGVMVLITNCFNVLGPDGSYMYVGTGSPIMAEQAASATAGVVWVQEACNTVLPSLGGVIVAFSLLFFAFSTTVAYYYEGESGLAYLARNKSQKTRDKMIWVLRIAQPLMFFAWFNVTAATAWAVSEIALGLMIWVNGIALIFLFPTVIRVYNDYMAQIRAGEPQPHFNPHKLGIKNADVWMDLNKESIRSYARRYKAEQEALERAEEEARLEAEKRTAPEKQST